MKTLIKSALLLLLVMSLTGCGDDVSSISSDDLVYRDGVYYKKFSDVPFSGKVTGLRNGSIKNGKFDGEWVGYYDNGQLRYKGNYKNGKREGAWVYYLTDGNLMKDFSGIYKNGVKISD